MTRRLPLAGAVVLAASACGTQQLLLTLWVPVTPSGAFNVDSSFQVRAVWDGGGVGASVTGFSQGFKLAVPTGVPLDLEVDGADYDGGAWRGERHGLVVPEGSAVDAGILMTPVGAIASFPALRGLPAPGLEGATVTPLDQGRVLIVGGRTDASKTAETQAWIYDQATLSFTQAAVTQLPWAHHLALPLGGNLFILAGGDGMAAGTAVELYSPTDGGKIVGHLSRPQLRPSGVVLNDGSVRIGCGLALGAADAGPDVVDSSQPGWSFAGLPSTPCAGGQLVVLSSGGDQAVVEVSPSGSVAGVATTVDLASMALPRSAFAAAADDGGGVIVVGGERDAGAIPGLVPVACTAVDDLQASDVAGTSLAAPRAGHLLFDIGASWLAVGGTDATGAAMSSVEVLPKSGAAGHLLKLSTARKLPAGAVIPGYGMVLILSGEASNGGAASGLDLYTIP